MLSLRKKAVSPTDHEATTAPTTPSQLEPAVTTPPDETTEPTEATKPADTEPTQPTVKPTEPTVPTEKPTEPTEKPTEPTVPTVKPTEPTEKPTEPTVPTEKPTEPTEGHTHTYTAKVFAPTCTAEGYTLHSCSCGDSYIGDKTGKTEHDYQVTATKAPTCTEKGNTTYTCKNCKGTKIGDEKAALGHDLQHHDAQASTCKVAGWNAYDTCSRCSYNTKKDTPLAAHQYSVTGDTATCTAGGTKTETCTVCGNTRQSDSPAKGHGTTRTESSVAGCTGGSVEKTICTVCNQVISEKTLPGTGSHSWGWERLSDVAKREVDKGNLITFAKFTGYTDHDVAVCTACGTVDLNNVKNHYDDWTAASIMLEYVNALREEALGTSEYNLVLSSRLIAEANLRAKEISIDFCHFPLPENITSAGNTIYTHFVGWKNSPGHYANMVNADFTLVGTYNGYSYFGYGMYWPGPGYAVFGVQVFGR